MVDAVTDRNLLEEAPDMSATLDEHASAVRAFNRFYTTQIGILNEGVYKSPFSLTEVRVLYELAHRGRPTATELARDLGLDAGYLSRILRRFHEQSLIVKETSKSDGRQSFLQLSRKGRSAFAPLEARSQGEVRAMLGKLSEAGQKSLVEAMRGIERQLSSQPKDAAAAKSPYLLRFHQPGDMGWVVHRHGVLYAQEYGYDERFEALVAEIVAHFIQHFDSKRERCWIAEREGEIVGSVFLVGYSKTVAKLRLLLVEPKARGLGIGARLVSECVRFARQRRYKKIVLWTQSDLYAARHTYKAEGFRIAGRKRHHDFGPACVAETWELAL
jgi:DNA-binding MarR family transcriptional regulator/GNAT superfamily N-acetyltransferase